jgi:hypothetical protein
LFNLRGYPKSMLFVDKVLDLARTDTGCKLIVTSSEVEMLLFIDFLETSACVLV